MKSLIYALVLCSVTHNSLFAGGGCTKFKKNRIDSDQSISPLPEEAKHMSFRVTPEISEQRKKEIQEKLTKNYFARQSLTRESSQEKSSKFDIAEETASELNTNSRSYNTQLGFLWDIVPGGTPGETPQ